MGTVEAEATATLAPIEVELALEANARRDVAKELANRADPDRREHLLAIPVRQ